MDSSIENASTQTTDLAELKSQIRKQAHENRRTQENKDGLSETIVAKFMALPEFERAGTVLFYVDVRAEVRTRHAFQAALATGKKIIVPWCNEAGELELFHMESVDELAEGMYRILEPKAELRSLAEKVVNPEDIDLIMVPGVGFDERGGRTGHGKGYYDKLLEHARPDCPLVALAFDCQMFPEIPMQSHDIFMDKVITESAIHAGIGRKDELA
ncbi:MAG: 5-formyltetrahydrofolate cyclo-ligase [Planctomycetaceae bacterium]|nr:5-formyltetrahydrofolate cyclo-ligase [Planctomycetaceae bacterium]